MRIVKAPRSDNFNKRLSTPHFGQARSGSWHDPAQLTGRSRARRAIRRLAMPFTGQQGGPGVALKTQGGTTNWRMSPAAEILTDNPNPKFDPSRGPSGSVPRRRFAIVKVANARKGEVRATGHGGEIQQFTGNATYRGMSIKKR